MPPVSSLFDYCVSGILKTPSLQGKAAAYLPQKVAHYLLYEACRAATSQNLLAVQNLIAAWPHRELSFNFLTNPICRRKGEASSLCLKASEYYGEFLMELQYETCANSIMIGLFKNVLNHVERGTMPTVELVDMRAIRIQCQQGKAIALQIDLMPVTSAKLQALISVHIMVNTLGLVGLGVKEWPVTTCMLDVYSVASHPTCSLYSV